MIRDARRVLDRRRGYVLVVVAALLVSAAAVPVVQQVAGGPDGTVAVVAIDGFIDSATTDAVVADLRAARTDESVGAVVLQVDSPGGSAAASERLYLAVKRTRSVMPVVAAVGSTGASGAYYAMLPADTIYVTPASIVGSVGVRTAAPGPAPTDEIRSGPDKGYTSAERIRAQVETLQRTFVRSVVAHRGDRLALTRTEVAHAKVYTGVRAVRNGLVDEIGTVEDATHEAARRAGYDHYDVAHTDPAGGERFAVLDTAEGTVVVERSPVGYAGVDSPTFLMVYGEVREDRVVSRGR